MSVTSFSSLSSSSDDESVASKNWSCTSASSYSPLETETSETFEWTTVAADSNLSGGFAAMNSLSPEN